MTSRTMLRSAPITSVGVLVAAAGFAACNAYESPLPPPPAVQTAAKPPPAISGGTLVVAKNGTIAVAADSDRDRVWAVDLAQRKQIAEIELEDGDEPGRIVEDGQGHFHVALRSGAAIVSIDVQNAQIISRTPACAAPRGLAYDAALDAVHLACSGGELMTFDASSHDLLNTMKLDADLRDIVVSGGQLLVSLFRSAEILRIDPSGATKQRVALPEFTTFGFNGETGEETQQVFEPGVAWRMIPQAGVAGGALMVHQRAMTTPVRIETGGYAGGGCDSTVVHGSVSRIDHDGTEDGVLATPPVAAPVSFSILPVDIATVPSTSQMMIVSAGSDAVFMVDPSMLDNPGDPCGSASPTQVTGGPVAVAFSGHLQGFVVQTREPAGLVLMNDFSRIDVPGADVSDTGHQMFHTNPSGLSALVCASCHPEGRDDGMVWNFDPIGPRRTPTLGGGILATAPLHWDGDMKGLDTIMSEVFVNRMGGQPQSPRKVKAFSAWIDALPAFRPNRASSETAVARGKALFEDKVVACASCHSGPLLTNNESVDVGTGRDFQVPPLVGLGSRAPFMHDGCAKTLAERFSPTVLGTARETPCGGTKHGSTAHLDETELGDLIAYLETL